jgi:hypothetical protein
MESERESFVAECFWPDVDAADLAELDRRIEDVIAGLQPAEAVRYLGAILLREDEVVLCRFEGSVELVRDVAERAEVPFDRILAAAQSPWPLTHIRGS